MASVYYIYKTTHHRSDGIRYYIGQHFGELDDDYYGSGPHLKNAINKYPEAALTKEILEICDSRESLDEAEIKWISRYNADLDPLYYNMSKGGSKLIALRGPNNPFYGKVLPCYSKEKMVEILRTRCWNNPEAHAKRVAKLKSSTRFRENCSRAQILRYKDPEQRKKTSETTKLGFTDDVKSKISQSLKERWKDPKYRGQYDFKGENNPFYGHTHSEESRKKMSESRTGLKNHFYGKHHREDSKEKSSNSMKKFLGDHPEDRIRRSESAKGRKSITDGVHNKRVKLSELDDYLSKGWFLGVTK